MGDTLLDIAVDPDQSRRLDRYALLLDAQRGVVEAAARARLRRWRRAMLITVALVVGAAAAYGAVVDRHSDALGSSVKTARDSLELLKKESAARAVEITRLSSVVVQLEARRLKSRAAFLAASASYDSLRSEYDGAVTAADSAAFYYPRSEGDTSAGPIVPLPDPRPVLAAADGAVKSCRVALFDCELARDSTHRLLELTRSQLATRTAERDLTQSLIPTRRQRLVHDAKVTGGTVLVLKLLELLAGAVR